VKSLLIVEEDRHRRLLLAEGLREEGYDVRTATSGNEALAQIYAGIPDMVVLDPDMAGTDGTRLLGRLLGFRRHLPVVIYTASGGARESFRSWAADAYVVKRSDLAELKDTIRRVLDGRGSRSGRAATGLRRLGA